MPFSGVSRPQDLPCGTENSETIGVLRREASSGTAASIAVTLLYKVLDNNGGCG
jgi:hypothetical protein